MSVPAERCRDRLAQVRPLLAIGAAVLVVAGCGSGDDGDGGDEGRLHEGRHCKRPRVAQQAPRSHLRMAPGKDCVVIRVLTSSDEVESAQSVADEVPTALAVNSGGDAGVIFAGYGTLLPRPVCCTC